MTTAPDPENFESLLDLLRRSRGFDFGAYKRSSLARRVQKRMHTVNAESYAAYRDYLEVHPEEFTLLFNTILINVTGFFRDAQAWEALVEEGIRPLVATRPAGDPIRAWCAGCASGEEAYTLAMLLQEGLGGEAYRERVKIYATDADEEALNQARQATYGEKTVEEVPEPLRKKYFDVVGGQFVVNKDLRRSVIFGRHDLIQDAPISRVDLLTCRNTLMYFNAEAQARVLARFNFALNDGGLLFLGKAETMLTHHTMFGTVDLKRRIFVKLHGNNVRDRMLMTGQAPEDVAPGAIDVRIRDLVFGSAPTAQLVVDPEGVLILANKSAQKLFAIGPRALGRPLQDLEVSYKPVELRSCIDRANAERRAIVLKDVEWRPAGGEPAYFEVQVAPLTEGMGPVLGVAITFLDTTATRHLQGQLQRTNQELETALEELQSTNEELETTNEELQSTVEELETTNEELQSTNEELETMNEELQSTNEELHTLNHESRERGEEVSRLNHYLESILAGLRSGVVVVDQDIHVRIWNERAADLWGLRSDEVMGRNFLNLDIGLPVDQLRKPIRDCLTGEVETQSLRLDAINRRGRAVHLAVLTAPLGAKGIPERGVILLMDELGDGQPGDGVPSDGAKAPATPTPTS